MSSRKSTSSGESGGDPTRSEIIHDVIQGQNCDVHLVIRQEPNRCRVLSEGEFVDRRPIEPIPVVQLVVKDHVGKVSRAALQQTNYFMTVSLVTPEEPAAAVKAGNSRSSVFSGARASSLYCLRDLDGSDAGLFVFPNLSVRRQGSFRLRFELFSLEGNQAKRLVSLDSRVFKAHPIHSFPGSDGSSPLCKLLIDQGVKIPFRKRFRASNPPRHLTLKKFGEEATGLQPVPRYTGPRHHHYRVGGGRGAGKRGLGSDDEDEDQDEGSEDEEGDGHEDEEVVTEQRAPPAAKKQKRSHHPQSREEDRSVGELLCQLKNSGEKKAKRSTEEVRDSKGGKIHPDESVARGQPLSTQQLASAFASAPADFQQTPFAQELCMSLARWPNTTPTPNNPSTPAPPVGYVMVPSFPFPATSFGAPMMHPSIMPQAYPFAPFSLPPVAHLFQKPAQAQATTQLQQQQQQLEQHLFQIQVLQAQMLLQQQQQQQQHLQHQAQMSLPGNPSQQQQQQQAQQQAQQFLKSFQGLLHPQGDSASTEQK